jgi:polysaccharide biosynthesis/export protein
MVGAERKASEATLPQTKLSRYLIGAGDVIQVAVAREPDASVSGVVVRSDGIITLPMLKEIQAAGLTTSELEAQLTQKYARLIREPVVSVVVKEIHSEKIYVIGAVRKEGPVRLLTPLNVLQAIAEAGGLTDYAKRGKIYILRPAEGGQQTRLPFDYPAVLRGDRIEQNIMLHPGDTIVVPQ